MVGQQVEQTTDAPVIEDVVEAIRYLVERGGVIYWRERDPNAGPKCHDVTGLYIFWGANYPPVVDRRHTHAVEDEWRSEISALVKHWLYSAIPEPRPGFYHVAGEHPKIDW